MAVSNSLTTQTKNAVKRSNEVVYMAGEQEVRLTPEVAKKYLVSGNKENVSTEELVMFINLCKYSGLNPWLKEAYFIKYGSEPATLVTGKEAFQKRAEDNPFYDGSEAGIIVCGESGEMIYRNGTVKLPGEKIIGGYAEVWRKDRTHSTRIEVSFDEYAGRKKDGSLNGQWSKKPATMIRKVALVQALREAFPKTFGGLYSAEEQGMIEEPADIMQSAQDRPIDVEANEVPQSPNTAPSLAPAQQAVDPATALFG